MNLSTTKIGDAGEHFVMAELNLQGHYGADLCRPGRPGVDIQVHTDDRKSACIQVKTTTNVRFTIGDVPRGGENSWYFLVKIQSLTNKYQLFIVRRSDVLKLLENGKGIYGKPGIGVSKIPKRFEGGWDLFRKSLEVPKRPKKAYQKEFEKQRIRLEVISRKKNGQYRKDWDHKRVMKEAHKRTRKALSCH